MFMASSTGSNIFSDKCFRERRIYMKEGIGKRIKFMRKHKGYTQEKLARLANVTQSYISAIESGCRLPNVEVLSDIARVLDVSVDYILNGENPQ